MIKMVTFMLCIFYHNNNSTNLKGLARCPERARQGGNGAFHREGVMGRTCAFPREGGKRGPGIVLRTHSTCQGKEAKEEWSTLAGAASQLGTRNEGAESSNKGLLEDSSC